MRLAAEWEGDGHDEGGDADLEGCELAGGDSVRGVGDGEEVSGEGDSADKCEEIAEADADEEVLEGRSRRCCEKEQAGEGEEGSDGSSPSWTRCVGRAESGNDSEEWDEDDDQASDEGGLRGGGAGEAGGLKLVARGEKDSYDQAGDERASIDVTKLLVIHDNKGEESQRHAEEIEEKRRRVLQGVFDEDEGCAPDEDDCKQQQVSHG